MAEGGLVFSAGGGGTAGICLWRRGVVVRNLLCMLLAVSLKRGGEVAVGWGRRRWGGATWCGQVVHLWLKGWRDVWVDDGVPQCVDVNRTCESCMHVMCVAGGGGGLSG